MAWYKAKLRDWNGQRGRVMIRIVTQLTIVLGLCVVSVQATAGADRGTAEAACTPDVFRLCSAQIPDEKRIVACLKQNTARLSPACRKVFS